MSQSNTQEGDILLATGEDLSTYADVLVAIYNSSNLPVVTRPVANNDYAAYLLIYGATAGLNATVRPLSPNRSVRVVANGLDERLWGTPVTETRPRPAPVRHRTASRVAARSAPATCREPRSHGQPRRLPARLSRFALSRYR